MRITQAFWDLVEPTPTKVRAILNDLGYVDERIHDLKQSGATTRFFLANARPPTSRPSTPSTPRREWEPVWMGVLEAREALFPSAQP
ncbi:hypothetical protein [Streptomyces caelestis]|uniref:Uncharacterized protein n=1 Tax=Streptomyces caelestis TaxID=36816 RepID=A0A7W9LXR2_9ACTN|nr:hypothetical protein [Streptomyces caelestis]MBB5800095.1 hypothetical protein [Streptomyces caelestis]GGW76730.1 hypothetical protein GCM10010320_68640 [Streptomyces caelestis]